jgi:hypothetical protein
MEIFESLQKVLLHNTQSEDDVVLLLGEEQKMMKTLPTNKAQKQRSGKISSPKLVGNTSPQRGSPQRISTQNRISLQKNSVVELTDEQKPVIHLPLEIMKQKNGKTNKSPQRISSNKIPPQEDVSVSVDDHKIMLMKKTKPKNNRIELSESLRTPSHEDLTQISEESKIIMPYSIKWKKQKSNKMILASPQKSRNNNNNTSLKEDIITSDEQKMTKTVPMKERKMKNSKIDIHKSSQVVFSPERENDGELDELEENVETTPVIDVIERGNDYLSLHTILPYETSSNDESPHHEYLQSLLQKNESDLEDGQKLIQTRLDGNVNKMNVVASPQNVSSNTSSSLSSSLLLEENPLNRFDNQMKLDDHPTQHDTYNFPNTSPSSTTITTRLEIMESPNTQTQTFSSSLLLFSSQQSPTPNNSKISPTPSTISKISPEPSSKTSSTRAKASPISSKASIPIVPIKTSSSSPSETTVTPIKKTHSARRTSFPLTTSEISPTPTSIEHITTSAETFASQIKEFSTPAETIPQLPHNNNNSPTPIKTSSNSPPLSPNVEHSVLFETVKSILNSNTSSEQKQIPSSINAGTSISSSLSLPISEFFQDLKLREFRNDASKECVYFIIFFFCLFFVFIWILFLC